jgi:thioester reductase-like protein
MRPTDRLLAKKQLALAAAQVDLLAEARLDPTIQPLGGMPLKTPERVLVTGGTGYLGAFLIAGLLERPNVEVYSLVRAPNAEAAAGRQRSVLQSYRLWDESRAVRLHTVLGDLGRPALGLAESEFARLANEVDAVFHAGAVVNLVFPYSLLKPPNVNGTKEVLRLVTTGRSKWLHYVSTNGFFLTPEYAGRQVPEDDPALATAHLTHGYMQTKWVAEQLVLQARDRGVLASLYRPTFIGWHSRTGVYNAKDFMCALIDGCLQLGVAPELDLLVEVAPVDYVAGAILRLSEDRGSIAKAFNVGSPHRVPFRDVIAACRSLGWVLRSEPYESWRALLERSRDNAAYPFHSMLPELGQQTADTVGDALSSARFPRLGFAQIEQALSGTGLVCPRLDAELLAPHLAELARTRALRGAPADRTFAQWAPR